MKRTRLYPNGLTNNYRQAAAGDKISRLSAAFVKKVVKTFPDIELLDLQYTTTRDVGLCFSQERCRQARAVAKKRAKKP